VYDFRELGDLLRIKLQVLVKWWQVLRLNENKDFSYAEAQEDFGLSPLSFEEGIKSD
jgi:hypothetical protein